MDPGKEPSPYLKISRGCAHLGNILVTADDEEYRQPGKIFLYEREPPWSVPFSQQPTRYLGRFIGNG